MTDELTVDVDEEQPPHWVVAIADGDSLRVLVSPRVEAAVLAALRKDIGLAVAKALDDKPWEVNSRSEDD